MTTGGTSSLHSATVCVPSLSEAIDYYVGLLDQQITYRGSLGEIEALALAAPTAVGAEFIVLQPRSGADRYLRLIHSQPPPSYLATCHLGWAALEISIADADALHARLVEAGQRILGEPKELAFSDALYPMQALGPGGEALYLNEIRGNLPDMDLPMARCSVDQLFICVLAASDRAASQAWYDRLLGTRNGGEIDLAYGVINQAFGLPDTTLHRLSTSMIGRQVLLEIDQYPPVALAGVTAESGLHPGIAAVAVRAQPAQSTSWVCKPSMRELAPFEGLPVGSLRGPDGELIEVICG